MDKIDIGVLLNKARIGKNLSQQEMADLAGFSRRQQVMELEQAKADYGISTFLKALEALDLTLSIVSIPKKQTYDFSKTKSAKKGDPEEKVKYS